MEDKEIYEHKAGPLELEVAFKDGKLEAKVSVGGKALLDMLAAEAKAKTGSDIPVEIASFLEKALGLA